MARQGSESAARVADRQLGWVERLPAAWRPYAVLARWDRPIGTWLLLWPCWWSLLLAPGWPDPWLVVLFGLGAIVMRGAGCVLNDLADRDLDARVERTRNRPLASGQVSVLGALLFMAAQLLVGLLILLSFNPVAIALGFAVLPLILTYPLMKRITWWPQLWLGFNFNWGALLGWAAVTGGLAPAPLALYLAGIFWTLGYDTIYAHQDKVDDALIGVKSSARRLGAATRPWLWAFYGIAWLLLALAGALASLGPGFYLGLLAVGGHFAWQIRGLDIDDPTSCLRRFRSNRDAGALIALAVLAGQAGP
jgi:4-hydroxybenzoate polyprenyltransferase